VFREISAQGAEGLAISFRLGVPHGLPNSLPSGLEVGRDGSPGAERVVEDSAAVTRPVTSWSCPGQTPNVSKPEFAPSTSGRFRGGCQTIAGKSV